MQPPLDTSIDAQDRQLELLRAMSPGKRLEMADTMSDEVRLLAAAGIRARHPDWAADQVTAAVLELLRRSSDR